MGLFSKEPSSEEHQVLHPGIQATCSI